jgi:alanine racemase
MNAHSAGAVLTVDLDAIVANWRLISTRVAPNSRAAAVVKTDAYGLGAAPVARALFRAGCTRFFVATTLEAIELRPVVGDAEILVLNGFDESYAAAFAQYRLIPVLNTMAQARMWGHRPAALQVDSGMARLGVSLEEAATLAGSLEVLLVVSHLACADSPDHPLNRDQLQIFNRARTLFPGIEASFAASSGVFLGPDFHADWVRPGAALYGVNPTPGRPNPMAATVRLEAKILQLRRVDQNASVGYGATHRTSGPARLATVAAGYADGLFRSLGNRGHGHFGDEDVPLVGRVSMDLTVFDVSRVQDEALAEGAMLELIGPHISIDRIAADAGTIGYEILTSLGPRIQRRYLGTA